MADLPDFEGGTQLFDHQLDALVAFIRANRVKLDNIEAGADVTDRANVYAQLRAALVAGANVSATNDDSAQTVTIASMPPAALVKAVSWNATTRLLTITHFDDSTTELTIAAGAASSGLTEGEVDGRIEALRPNPFTAADEAKLDGIETRATADQTAAEVPIDTVSFGGNLPAGAGADNVQKLAVAFDTYDFGAVKLAGIEAGAEVNVNADWNASSGDAEILNKPTLGRLAGLSSVAANLVTGVLDAARIPNLNANKITAGVLAAARIPGLAASKVTSGVFAVARIPDLNASKITAGTLPIARGGTGATSASAARTALGITGGGGDPNIPLWTSGLNPAVGDLVRWGSNTVFMCTASIPAGSRTSGPDGLPAYWLQLNSFIGTWAAGWYQPGSVALRVVSGTTRIYVAIAAVTSGQGAPESNSNWVRIDGGGGGGLNQAAVDARVRAGVSDWAEQGNADAIPAGKLTNAPSGGATFVGSANVDITADGNRFYSTGLTFPSIASSALYLVRFYIGGSESHWYDFHISGGQLTALVATTAGSNRPSNTSQGYEFFSNARGAARGYQYDIGVARTSRNELLVNTGSRFIDPMPIEIWRLA